LRTIKVYCAPGGTPPFYEFLSSLDERLSFKLLYQIASLADRPMSNMKEPHIKHFSIEKYSHFYEVREKGKVLVRVIFTIYDGDILLLAPFVKRQPRDTMRALELSARMLSTVREHPDCAIKFVLPKEDKPMK
jgi:hypothetical protein